jgi:hypothetical protein
VDLLELCRVPFADLGIDYEPCDDEVLKAMHELA